MQHSLVLVTNSGRVVKDQDLGLKLSATARHGSGLPIEHDHAFADGRSPDLFQSERRALASAGKGDVKSLALDTFDGDQLERTITVRPQVQLVASMDNSVHDHSTDHGSNKRDRESIGDLVLNWFILLVLLTDR